MTVFDQYFNHDTLVSIGIRLNPDKEERFLDHLYEGFQRSLRKAVVDRIGTDEFEYVDDEQDEEYLLSLLPDWQNILGAEIDWWFQGCIQRAEKIQRGWEAA